MSDQGKKRCDWIGGFLDYSMSRRTVVTGAIVATGGVGYAVSAHGAGPKRKLDPGGVFNVKDFGATGVKADDARSAIQKAIDACAAAGGGPGSSAMFAAVSCTEMIEALASSVSRATDDGASR